MKIDRMLSILVILLNRKKVSAKELSEKFEVSVRTIYRDIDSINLAGIPVISFPGNTGGFGIMPNYRLDTQYFSIKDMHHILSTLKALNMTLDDSSIETAICKIENLLPGGKADCEVTETSVIDVLPWGFPEKARTLIKTLNRAISDKRLISMRYLSGKSEITERTVEPMTLVLKGTSCYLFAFCKTRSDFRIFKITRIKKLDVLESIFDRKNVSYSDYISDNPPHDWSMTAFSLKFSSEHKNYIEEYFDESFIHTDSDGSMIVNISIPDSDWVINWLMGMGPSVEILAPEKYRKKILENAKKTILKYQT